ncbi:MAG TPA: NAD(P)/FAD-dependent oxidoreductase [Hyphomicrobiaceae bacterium]|nr:NAD(P)/FAD-dependent oxidoreductase [Hyphomicrobiaceae bacterium]
MSERQTIDVLVVGLGPAGASAAAAAATRGARVIAIDRKRVAGVPVQCAEFVPALIGQQIPDLDQHRQQRIRAMTTFVEDEPPHLKEQFSGVMIDRRAFDAALVARAEQAGAQTWFGLSLRGIDADGSARLSDGSRLSARVIIGADGPRSAVGAAAGIENTALAETRQMTVPLLMPFEETDIFLSHKLPGGYAWLFPKGEVANLGLGGDPRWRAHFKPLLDDLHAQLAAQGRVGREVLGHTGGAIPSGGMLEPVAKIGPARLLLAGDAAGLTNPITGAGILAAVISGEMAGEAAAALASGNASAAAAYRDDLADMFQASLARAVARREALMRIHAAHKPAPSDLRRAWIAFPEYWAA